MAKSGGLIIPPELQKLFNKLMRRINSRSTGAIGLNTGIQPRSVKRDVSRRSLLPECSALWETLSEAEKNAWSDAGEVSLYSGWQMFVQDTSYRLKFGLPGLATPSTLHQYKVGHILIEAPATEAKIQQAHPRDYYIRRKVTGDTRRFEEVQISEPFDLPLEIGISYRADLQATSGEPNARFYAEVESHFQGQKIHTQVGIDFDLQTDWQRHFASISDVVGTPRSYTLYIDLTDVRGVLEFDNLWSFHSGDNFARDFRCTNVNQPLSQTYFMVSPSWSPVFTPVGVDWDSVYPDDAPFA